MIKGEHLFAVEDMTQSDRCLHTPSAFAKQNLLYVQEVGFLKSLKPHNCVRENLDSFLFLVVLDGKGSLTIKGKHYEISAGDCALIDCMEHYEHISDAEDAWKLAWVHFNGHAARGYYELFMKNNSESNIFSVRNLDWWNDMLAKILEVQKDRKLQAELYCGELLQQLVNQIISCVLNAAIVENEQEKQAANLLRELMNEQYAEPDILQRIEAEFGEDIHTLGVKFAKWYGISIEEYVSNRRFNAAKELLRFSIKPVEEVASESGIGDIIALQQMFRENEGMTAEEYRAKWAQWIR